MQTDRIVPRRHTPAPEDVVCARGRGYWDHPGNVRFRRSITLAKEKYSDAKKRSQKSYIVSEIIRGVSDSNGRFVKLIGREWTECDEYFIREKVTQSLRDNLSFKYSSSTIRKRQRKARIHDSRHGDIDSIVHSNAAVSRKIELLKKKLKFVNSLRTEKESRNMDELIMRLFDQANLDILETIKLDQSMIQKWQQCNFPDIDSKSERVRRVSLSSSSSTNVEPVSSRYPSLLEDPGIMESSESKKETSSTVQVEADLDCACDDSNIILDLDAPSMFLDEIGRYC